MSDIVERLRHQPLVLYGREQVIADISLLSEAADEIEFLNKVIEVERKEHKEAVEAERKKHEWRDMNEEQPTDGTLAVVGWWTKDNWWHAETDVYAYDAESESERWDYSEALTTHWIPLPDPPKGEDK